MFSILYF
ncbi:unnamed protein product [Acanthoscelides obtectus]|nr:unnamed protein product [Acanthoscelides obtectus]CAK1638641.1 hypothetical protein AOBTE_LOCUS10725 [Acanthoscelides obtectus]